MFILMKTYLEIVLNKDKKLSDKLYLLLQNVKTLINIK